MVARGHLISTRWSRFSAQQPCSKRERLALMQASFRNAAQYKIFSRDIRVLSCRHVPRSRMDCVMLCATCGWSILLKQDCLQGYSSVERNTLAINDPGIGSGWQQSKQNWAHLAVEGRMLQNVVQLPLTSGSVATAHFLISAAPCSDLGATRRGANDCGGPGSRALPLLPPSPIDPRSALRARCVYSLSLSLPRVLSPCLAHKAVARKGSLG